MIAFLLIVLAGLFSAAVAFAITFTVVSFYIVWKRRDRPKYCYSEPAEPVPVRPNADVDRSEPSSNIDGGSAVRDWAGRP